MQLVGFYNENKITKHTPIEKSEDGDENDDEPEFETEYQLTALGMGAIDQKLAELLYRLFIVGALQAQGENAARYENSRDTLLESWD